MNNLHLLLDSLDIRQNKQLILAGDFNAFLYKILEAKGGSLCLKNKSVAKLIKIKAHFDLRDIWRLRNPDVKQFTCRQKHASGFIQRRLDYFFISNSIQDLITHADFFAALSTDHSPVTISISKSENRIHGHGFWKFNSSLLSDQNYVTKTKNLIQTFHSNQNLIPNAQLKWELLKYKIRKFTINYSKKLAKERKENKTLLENKLKELEGNLNTEDNLQSYNICKNELESIYDHIAEGIRVRSKCDWYEHGEKLTKFSLNLEEKRGNQNQIRKLIIDQKEIDGDVEIFKKIESFFKTLFNSQPFKNIKEIELFLCGITTPSLNNDQINLCEKDLSETDLYNAMKNMQNNKSPGNDGLTKEFYEGFWDEIKELLIASATEAKQT